MFFELIYIPRALSTGTCIQQGDLFYSAGLTLMSRLTATERERTIGRLAAKDLVKLVASAFGVRASTIFCLWHWSPRAHLHVVGMLWFRSKT